ncbi:MAG: (d)CMP kinase [Firmicutes bacterium]|jgi:cytidylate kinase|nr:(d)CMP kinase [Bacillota bacterium]
MRGLQVAIDGPAGSGKSTVARRVARELGYLYIDTGAMYRAVTLQALRRGVPIDDPVALECLARETRVEFVSQEDGVQAVYLNGEEVTRALRSPEVNEMVSHVAKVPGVRRELTRLQQKLGAAGGVVMDGRDVGTVVLPQAEVKVFLTASIEERVRRRLREMEDRGYPVSTVAVKREVLARDCEDESRALAPLKPAADAVLLDSTYLSVNQVVKKIVSLVRQREQEDRRSR